MGRNTLKFAMENKVSICCMEINGSLLQMVLKFAMEIKFAMGNKVCNGNGFRALLQILLKFEMEIKFAMGNKHVANFIKVCNGLRGKP